jgi:ABC-type multidrug transport system fused ATPase/permease subunit
MARHSRFWLLASLGPSGIATAALDLASRLSIPATLLMLSSGNTRSAWIAAAGANAVGVIRGIWCGIVQERRLFEVWSRLILAGAQQDLRAVITQRRNITVLVYAAAKEAQAEAQIKPRIVADSIGLLLTASTVVWRLGPVWLLAGLVVGSAVAPFAIVMHRRLKRVERASFDETNVLIERCGLLFDGAVELRAHGVARIAHADALTQARRAAAERRVGTLWRALAGLMPIGFALLLAIVPLAKGWLQLEANGAAAAILAATAITLGLGLLNAVQDLNAARPQSEALTQFLEETGIAETGEGDGVVEGGNEATGAKHDTMPEGWLRDATVDFSDVAVVYPGSSVQTPAPVHHRWSSREGLALLGDNGSGKSTLALALLGLIQPTGGSISVGAKQLDEGTSRALRSRTILVPQRPFVAPSRSVGWHLRYLSDSSDSELLRALDAFGIAALLRQRNPDAPLEVPAGQLSGGEQRRMLLARALLPRNGRKAELVILDEPEAGLDSEGRARLTEMLVRLASDSRVLVIAHDRRIVPTGFGELNVERDRVGVDTQTVC